MERQKERWFIRSREHTLGPFTMPEIEAGLKSGELLFDDNICLQQEGVWQPLRLHPRFAPLAPPGPRGALLELPPPVNVLWKKKREPYAPPAAPSLPQEEHPPTLAAESSPTRTPSPAPAAAPAAPPRARTYSEDSFPDPRHVALSLKAALRDWARTEECDGRRKPAYELPVAPRPDIPPPAAPVETFFLPEPKPGTHGKKSPAIAAEEPAAQVIRIELRFPRIGGLFFLMLLALGLAGAAAYFAWPNKMRDLKGFHLSDPSSPTTEPSTESDPIPPLKAPTRPQRE